MISERTQPQSKLTASCAVALILMAAIIHGCGGGGSDSDSAEAANSDGGSQSTKTDNDGGNQQNGKQSASDGPLKTDGKGNRWVGDVPFDVYDVFFDEPLVVVSDSQVVTTNSGGTGVGMTPSMPEKGTGGTTPAENTAKPPADSGSGGSVAWEEIVSSEILLAEAKRLRNDLTNTLRSVGTYNRDFKSVQYRGATLSMVAGILIEHPGEVTWKDNAKYIRDLSTEMALGADATGRSAYEKAQVPFEKVIVMLNGSTPPDLPESKDKLPFGEYANRGWLMERMEKAQGFLKLNVQNEADLKSKAEDAIHEATILAAISKVLADEEYLFADEESYQNYVKEMIKVCQAAAEAVKQENIENYKAAMNDMQKACDQCHLEYRFE